MVSAKSQQPQPPSRRAGAFGDRRLVISVSLFFGAIFILALLPSTLALAVPESAHASAQPTPPSFPTPIRHVFIIMLENQILPTVLAQGPYLTSLYEEYAGADHYYGVCHPSAPNYLALTSGRLLQCGSDAITRYNVPNLADLVTSAGESWVAYMQSMPSPCLSSDSGEYVAHHDPFIYYRDVVSNASLCKSHVVPLTQFNASATPANLVWVTPDRLHDGHTPQSVPNADAWLKSFLQPLLTEPWASSTVFFVTYDEGDYPNGTEQSSGYNGLDGGNAYFGAISPYSLGRGVFSNNASAYNLLATVDWLLGTGTLGQNDSSSTFPAMKSLFDFAPPPPVRYSISGEVRELNGSASAGTMVLANGPGNSTHTETNATGAFTLALANGTYAVTAVASGWNSSHANITVAGSGLTDVNLTLSPMVYQFVGRVTNAISGSPIGNATVEVNVSGTPARTTTNATGEFVLRLADGTYPVELSAFLYVTANRTFLVGPNDTSGSYPLVPAPTFTIDVTFAEAHESEPVTNATVVVTTPNGTLTFREENGSLDLQLPNGTYQVKVMAAGLAPAAINLVISGNHSTPVRFVLSDQGTESEPGLSYGALWLPLLISLCVAGTVTRGLRLIRGPRKRWRRRSRRDGPH